MATTARKPNLKDVADKARRMYQDQRVWRYKRDEDPGPAWTVLSDWQKLSWFREAAAELEVEL